MLSVKTVGVDSELIDSLNASTIRSPEQQLCDADDLLEQLAALRGSLTDHQICVLIVEETGIDYDTVKTYITGDF